MERPAPRLPDAARWRRLSPLIDELLELDGDARAARLAKLQQAHPDLADELARIAGAHDSAHGEHFLAGAALEPFEREAAAGSLAGLRLGAYTLVAPLGQGGAGSVWRARRDDGRFEGEVAIKLLHLALVGAGAAQRFRREGAILAKLAHPHIARLLDAGIGEVGQPYLVLELVDGERIDTHCNTRRLTVEQRLTLFGQALEAVAHAHRHLVIHRDLKSSNILVTREGQVKLLDFGIAKLLDEETTAAEATQLTREGGRALTPGYAAPEQLRGEPVTTAADVYALGVLLHELLVGRHPTSASGAGPAEAMRATLEVEPAPLAAAWKDDAAGFAAIAALRATPPAALQRLLRGDLARIVARCLRKEPAQRYASVDALAEDLRRWHARQPISARPDSLAYRAGLFVRRHRGAVFATTLAGAAILAGVVGTVTQAQRAERQARQAQIERDHALQDLQFANASRDLLSFVLSQAHDKSLTGVEMLERAETLAESQFADDPLSRGRLQLTLGIEYGHLLDTRRAQQVLLKARAAANEAKHPALLSNVECLIAATLNDMNRPDEALPLFDAAIVRQRAAGDTQDTVLAACLQMRADLHAFRGRPQAMLEDSQAALALLAAPRADQRVLANALQVQVAEAHGRLGHVADAIVAYERALADIDSTGRGQTVRAAIRLNNFGRMLYIAGLPRRAEEIGGRGVALLEAMGGEHEMLALVRANRVRALIELGRLDEAQRETELAFSRATERQDRRVAGVAALYGAPAWCAAGQLARCAEWVATARTLAEATLPAGHPNRAAVELAAAQLALAGGRSDEALAALQRAQTLFASASETSPLAVRTLALLAGQALRRGDVPRAAAHAQAAVAHAREAARGLEGSLWLGEALAAEAAVRQAQGDTAGARERLEEAGVQLRRALGEQAPATRELVARLATG